MLCLNSIIIHEVFFRGGVLSEENGFLENISAFSFLFAGVLLTFRIIYTNEFERRLTTTFAITCFLCFVREVDIEDHNVPYLIKSIGHGLGRNLLFSLGYIFILGSIIYKDRFGFVGKARSCLKSPVSKVVILGVVGIILGAICENYHAEFAEELSEMNGSLMILFASIINITHSIYISNKTLHPTYE
jgi:hypothetical protein